MGYKVPFASNTNWGTMQAGSGLSVIDGVVSVNPSPGIHDVGYFYSTLTQLNLLTINITSCTNTFLSQGVTLVGGTQFTVSKSGNYTLTYTIQANKTAGGSAANIDIWLRLNGIDVADSNSNFTISNNNAAIVAAANYTLILNAGDYLELAWHSDSANAELLAVPAQVAPIRPTSPSVRVTLLQV
jgi:hypothetical protein